MQYVCLQCLLRRCLLCGAEFELLPNCLIVRAVVARSGLCPLLCLYGSEHSSVARHKHLQDGLLRRSEVQQYPTQRLVRLIPFVGGKVLFVSVVPVVTFAVLCKEATIRGTHAQLGVHMQNTCRGTATDRSVRLSAHCMRPPCIVSSLDFDYKGPETVERYVTGLPLRIGTPVTVWWQRDDFRQWCKHTSGPLILGRI